MLLQVTWEPCQSAQPWGHLALGVAVEGTPSGATTAGPACTWPRAQLSGLVCVLTCVFQLRAPRGSAGCATASLCRSRRTAPSFKGALPGLAPAYPAVSWAGRLEERRASALRELREKQAQMEQRRRSAPAPAAQRQALRVLWAGSPGTSSLPHRLAPSAFLYLPLISCSFLIRPPLLSITWLAGNSKECYLKVTSRRSGLLSALPCWVCRTHPCARPVLSSCWPSTLPVLWASGGLQASVDLAHSAWGPLPFWLGLASAGPQPEVGGAGGSTLCPRPSL